MPAWAGRPQDLKNFCYNYRMKNKILILLAVVLIILVAWMFVGKKAVSQTGSQLGERCGGNMTNAPVCATGLHCAPEAGSHLPFGDVGGQCVKD